MANGKFRVRRKSDGWWVFMLSMSDTSIALCGNRSGATFEDPLARSWFEARPDEYEIVEVPPPFVFPPTPWAFGLFGLVVDANGQRIFGRPDGKSTQAEMIRRVNWHEKALDALRSIDAGVGGRPSDVARHALDDWDGTERSAS